MNERPLVVLPTVTLKYAQTLDGRIATLSGHSRWISDGKSRAYAHQLRANHDAVLVGIGTVLADDPRLTVRLSDGNNPLRVVVDTHLRFPLEAAMIRESPEQTLVVTGPTPSRERSDALQDRGVQVMRAPLHDGRVDLNFTLQEVAQRGVRSIMVEGGSAVITTFLRDKMVDRVVLFIAPKIIGRGIDAVGDLGIPLIDRAITFHNQNLVYSGQDIIFEADVTR